MPRFRDSHEALKHHNGILKHDWRSGKTDNFKPKFVSDMALFKVKDLQQKLKGLDPEMPVMVDITKPGMDMFHFVCVSDADMAETDQQEMFFIITPGEGMNEKLGDN